MDANGTKFQLLSGAEDFRTQSSGCAWDEQSQLFRLSTQQQPSFSQIPAEDALLVWSETAPFVQDQQQQFGFLSDDRRQLLYALDWPIENVRPVLASSETNSGSEVAELSLDPIDAPEDTVFIDLHLGGDGRAALPFTNGTTIHGVSVVHLGRRWQRSFRLTAEPKRVWVDHLNRIWVAADTWLALCSGEPLPQPYQPDPTRFEPVQVNPNPLQRQWQQSLPVGYQLLAMTADNHQLYMLAAHTEDRHQQLWVRSLDDIANRPLRRLDMGNVPFVIDMTALADERLALMLAHEDGSGLDLPVVDVPAEGNTLNLLPLRYPQHSQQAARFVTGEHLLVRYLSASGPKQLHRLQQARFPDHSEALLSRVLDSGEPDALWHRIYLDACIPSGCGLSIEVKPFDDISERGSDWQQQPPPQWQPLSSELPFYESRFAPNTERSQGLYEILLQRGSGAVREIRGRYIQLRLTLTGDGRHSPAIATIRIHHPRFSWQQAYLPRHFHQHERPDGGIDVANAADVRERMLAGFEGIMTPIESRIAHAECWLSPATAPEARLPSIAAMLGVNLPKAWPITRQRHWLQFQAELQHHKGSFAGLCLALDIATDGAVSRGLVVPVENYRLRRTLATIVGVDMNDDTHPLTLGTGQSGNSIVGESLILTDDEALEFMALFAPELAQTEVAQHTVERFFDRYAYRLSIVVHGDARDLHETLRQILTEYVPAHLQWRLLNTDHPFVLGLSPLLGIDTYLERQPDWREIVLNNTYLGREGLLRNRAVFSSTYAPSIQGDPA